MQKKTRKEIALEMSDRGMSMKEISRVLDIPYNTVYGWLRKPNIESRPGDNADRHLCKTCRYRTGSADRNSIGANCDYLCLVGHSRGCKPEQCTVYVKGPRMQNKKKMGG